MILRRGLYLSSSYQALSKRYVSYVQEFVSKDGKPLKVVAFYKIENKLLAGHRVIKVSAAVIE